MKWCLKKDPEPVTLHTQFPIVFCVTKATPQAWHSYQGLLKTDINYTWVTDIFHLLEGVAHLVPPDVMVTGVTRPQRWLASSSGALQV